MTTSTIQPEFTYDPAQREPIVHVEPGYFGSPLPAEHVTYRIGDNPEQFQMDVMPKPGATDEDIARIIAIWRTGDANAAHVLTIVSRESIDAGALL